MIDAATACPMSPSLALTHGQGEGLNHTTRDHFEDDTDTDHRGGGDGGSGNDGGSNGDDDDSGALDFVFFAPGWLQEQGEVLLPCAGYEVHHEFSQERYADGYPSVTDFKVACPPRLI